jgi:hypothetical protein
MEAEQANAGIGMKLPFVEEARESIGLILAAAVLLIYFVAGLRGRRLFGEKR